MTYEQIRQKQRERLSRDASRAANSGAKMKGDQVQQIQGIHVDAASTCPECGHKYPIRIVANQIGLIVLSPNYNRKGEPQYS